jgi:phospholipase C
LREGNARADVSEGQLDRRRFLGAAAGLALGAASAPLLTPGMAGAAAAKRPRVAPSILDGPALESPVDTIVVVMLENRSFDHFLGWLGDDEAYHEHGRRRFGKQFHVDARTDVVYRDAIGNDVQTAPLVGAADESNPWRGCGHPVPGHGWFSGRIQLTEGFLAEGTGNDEYAVGYYRRDDLPLLGQLADRFAVCDRSFSSLCSGTIPNRQYMHAAQSVERDDPGPLRPGMYTTPTIWDKLLLAQVPCGYYYTDLPVLLLWGQRYDPVINPIDRYFEQCASGTLPNVVMVDPGFGGDLRTDQHTDGDVRLGQRWLSEVVSAFTRSPQWSSGMLVITYDEWGGFFDHVKPALFDDPRATDDLTTSFGLGGFRVPTMVLSPYATRGSVDHTVYDHTSILRAIEWRFLGAPPRGPGRPGQSWALTTRDQHAENIMGGLRAPSPDLDVEVELTDLTEDANVACALPPPQPPRVDLSHENPFELHAELEDLLARDYPGATYFPWLAPTA